MIKKGVSYFGNRFLKHFKEDLREIRSACCNYIIHTFSENDLLYYRKTLKEFVKISKDNGLEVYIDPWGVGKIFGGEAFSGFVAEHPEDCQVLATGERVPAACPNSRAFQSFMMNWVEQACALDPDVIFWDEPHYFVHYSLNQDFKNSDWACFCESCRNKFKYEYGRNPEFLLTEEMVRFREKSLLNFLEPLLKKVKEMKVKNALCLLPMPSDEVEKRLGIQDWETFTALEEVDIVSTDPYWALMKEPLGEFIKKFGGKIVELALKYHKESEIWIQGFRIPSEREKEVSEAVQLVSDLNPTRIAVWSYQGTGCMSELSCERPGKVWGIIKKNFKKLDQQG